ncbi:hypothetical protein FRC12_006487 [Ceratobasidium sp. 428]|nr:hypothetical protein FRC12_006487 [Ceratobasidium sp. 428]
MGGRLLASVGWPQKSSVVCSTLWRGLQYQECLNGMYLAVAETTDTKPRARVVCGRYPTTWELNQGLYDHEMYIIKQAGVDRVVDLGGAGNAQDGTQAGQILC